MTARILVDTNVLVYAYDRSEPAKQAQAIALLETLFASNSAALSTQVLIEFLNAVTRKIKLPLTLAEAHDRIEHYVDSWTVLPVTADVVLEAARGARDLRLSLWDAQIWATARKNNLDLVLSEDFSDDSSLEGVRFLDPFRTDFQLAECL